MKPAALPAIIKAAFIKYKSKPILRWGIALFWAAGLSLVGWLVYQSRTELYSYLSSANYWHLLGILIFYAISFGFSVCTWGLIIHKFSPEISLWTHIKIFSITLASRRLPGTIWYVGGRAFYYQKFGVSLFNVSLASILEMASWIISGFVLGAFLLPAILGWSPIALLIFRLAAVAAFLLFHPRPIMWAMNKLGHPINRGLRYRDTLAWLLMTAGGWLGGGGIVLELANALKPIGVGEGVYILGAWSLAGALGLLTIFLPSSFGLTEISLASMLSARLPLSISIVISLMTRILTILFEYLLSIIFYRFRGRLGEINDPHKSQD